MEIQNKFYNLTSTPDLHTVIKANGNTQAQELNCMRIGIVEEFHPEDFTVLVQIANKKDLLQRVDGTRETRNYALIRAKVCFCNPFITNPIKKGDECVILFADREIESWFINGDINPLAYQRMHDLTDAVALFGIRSLPNMIQALTDCLHLFYGTSDIQIKNNSIVINTDKITLGNTDCIEDGSHIVGNGSTIVTKNGIITSIS